MSNKVCVEQLLEKELESTVLRIVTVHNQVADVFWKHDVWWRVGEKMA
jgi:hypothetical protein